jgi:hypothetical protein
MVLPAAYRGGSTHYALRWDSVRDQCLLLPSLLLALSSVLALLNLPNALFTPTATLWATVADYEPSFHQVIYLRAFSDIISFLM